MKTSVEPLNPNICEDPDCRFRAFARVANYVRRVLPVIGLFLVAPLVAEFLLGNMSITRLGILAVLAPLYGGGALLIRESVRRTGRGWASILVLALAYGILEEAFLMETLFNPDFLGLNLHLLAPVFLPWFGIGLWYTIFVLTLHTVWSISVPIALVEALVPDRATSPWLGGLGTGLVALLFTAAAISIATFSIRQDRNHFMASRGQFIWSAVLVLVLVALAFRLPQPARVPNPGHVPGPWLIGFAALIAASAFLLVPGKWGWWAVAVYMALDVLTITAIFIWSTRSGWDGRHRLGLAGGAAMAYAWHAFVQTPSLGTAGAITRMGNLVFAVLAANLIAVGARRTADFTRQRSGQTGRR